jgi:hypothetical protein
MDVCKMRHSYLAGNIFLDDINKTCNALNITLIAPSWIGVASEVYYGEDIGKINSISTAWHINKLM